MGILQDGTLFDRSPDAHVTARPQKNLAWPDVAVGRVLRGCVGDGRIPRRWRAGQ